MHANGAQLWQRRKEVRLGLLGLQGGKGGGGKSVDAWAENGQSKEWGESELCVHSHSLPLLTPCTIDSMPVVTLSKVGSEP